MRGSEINIDLSEMTELEGPVKWYDRLILSVTARGEVVLNAKFRQALQGEKEGKIGVNIFVTNDWKIIGIVQDGDPKILFSERGHLKYMAWTQMLDKKGYALPAKYIIEWNEKAQMWVGVLQEVAEAPKVQRKRKVNG